MESKMLTIMFIDVQGFTSRTARQTREENQLFINELRAFIEKHVKDKAGNLVKAMGDGFLITFESPTNAVTCGIEMQKDIEKRNISGQMTDESLPFIDESDFIRFRIGINTGEVNIGDDGDVYGDAVNIAARIQTFAKPTEVFLAGTTYSAMNKTEINALDLGPHRFKHVAETIRVYKVLKDKLPKDKLPKDEVLENEVLKDVKGPYQPTRKVSVKSVATLGMKLTVLAMLVLLCFVYYFHKKGEIEQLVNYCMFRIDDWKEDIARLLKKNYYTK